MPKKNSRKVARKGLRLVRFSGDVRLSGDVRAVMPWLLVLIFVVTGDVPAIH